MPAVVWSLPLLFLFHDFEEILFLKPWFAKNGGAVQKRFPRLAKKLLPHFSAVTTFRFSLGVAEEFLLLCAVTVVSYAANWYALWFGLCAAFTLHLLMHCVQALLMRGYIPAVATSLLCLPVCFWVLARSAPLLEPGAAVFYTVLSLALAGANLAAIHICMDRFGRA